MNYSKLIIGILVCLLTNGCLMKETKLSKLIPKPKLMVNTPAKVTEVPITVPEPVEIAKIYYDGKSDGELILEAILEMEIAFLKSGLIKQGRDTVLVASLDHHADSEADAFPLGKQKGIETFVEDALIMRLTRAGFSSVERDLDILTRLYHESGEDGKYLISLSPDYQPEKILKELMALMTDQKDEAENPYAEKILNKFLDQFSTSNIPYVRYPFSGTRPLQDSIDISAAKYILSFRVLECGVNYRPVDSSPDDIKKVERIASAKFHLRLTDQRGVTIWSDIAMGSAKETAQVEALPFLRSSDTFSVALGGNISIAEVLELINQ